MGRPGGRGVVSGLNSILYQTHLYLHKQEACLLGRESAAIHFLSGCLTDEQKNQKEKKKNLDSGICGDGCETEGGDKYVLWSGELGSVLQVCDFAAHIY